MKSLQSRSRCRHCSSNWSDTIRRVRRTYSGQSPAKSKQVHRCNSSRTPSFSPPTLTARWSSRRARASTRDRAFNPVHRVTTSGNASAARKRAQRTFALTSRICSLFSSRKRRLIIPTRLSTQPASTLKAVVAIWWALIQRSTTIKWARRLRRQLDLARHPTTSSKI